MAKSTHRKGLDAEKKAKDLLKKDGWFVEQKNWNRFASKDFYKLFDILALRGSETKLIQVKSGISHAYSARKEIKGWLEENHLQVCCEVWLYLKEKNAFRIFPIE